MTVPTWPLAKGFSGDDYAEEGPDLVHSDQPDVGPAITRRRATCGVTTISGSLEPMTAEEKATLTAFYVARAGKRFSWVSPDDGVTPIDCRFVKGKPLSWSRSGAMHICKLSIEVLP